MGSHRKFCKGQIKASSSFFLTFHQLRLLLFTHFSCPSNLSLLYQCLYSGRISDCIDRTWASIANEKIFCPFVPFPFDMIFSPLNWGMPLASWGFLIGWQNPIQREIFCPLVLSPRYMFQLNELRHAPWSSWVYQWQDF